MSILRTSSLPKSAIGLALLALSWLIIACSSGQSSASALTQTPPSKAESISQGGASAPTQAPPSKAGPSATVGTEAPAFVLKDVEDHEVSLASYRGQVVILVFSNHYALGDELAWYADRYPELKGKPGLAVLTVMNRTEMPPHPDDLLKLIQRNLAKVNDLPMPLIDWDGKVSESYGDSTELTIVIVDQEGIIRYKHAGPEAGSGVEFESMLKEVLQ
jgi:peroxiredoxin